jgi:outer membrane receptor protein involved in Fe transport
MDASLGISKDKWYVEAFGQNLTNNNAFVSENNAQFIVTQVPLRPRVLGIKVGYRFSDK